MPKLDFASASYYQTWTNARPHLMTGQRARRVVKAALTVAILLATLSATSNTMDTAAAQPCRECGSASLIINGEVLSSNGVRAGGSVAFVDVEVLAQALSGNDRNGTQFGPHLSLDTRLYNPAGGGYCLDCRLYTVELGGCQTCRLQVNRKGLISGNILWADGWHFALPDLTQALGGTLAWNNDQTIYTITIPDAICSTCLLQYNGSSPTAGPGMPRTGLPHSNVLVLIPFTMLVIGICLRHHTSKRRSNYR